MLTHFSITQQGARHIERGDPCQDFSASRQIHLDRLNCDLALAAIADGVGSCMFSQYGAEAAVTGFLSCLTHNLNKDTFELSDASIQNLFEHGFRYALYQVSAKAKEMELPFTEFDSTLTGILFDGSNLWFGHVGDDGIVAMYADGTYEMITERHEGEESGALYPLCREEKWQFGKAPKEVASLVLMTDGILNCCVDGRAMNNRVFFPFLKPALTAVAETDAQAEELKQEWENILSGASEDSDGSSNPLTTDDITFVLVENPEAVAALPEIAFDQEKWDADTQKRREEVDKELYAEYWRYKEKRYPRSGIGLMDQADAEESGKDEPAADGVRTPLTETAPPAQPRQDEEEECGPQVQGAEKSARRKFTKFGDKTGSGGAPTQGTVIHTPADTQVSTPVLEVFESAYSVGRDLRKSMSQIFRKQPKGSEQEPRPRAPKPETEQPGERDGE